MTAQEYVFVPINPTSDIVLEDSSRLLREAFPGTTKFTAAFLKWQYLENPLGAVVGFNAGTQLTGDLAAHYATLPIRARIDGHECRGLLSLNTATHPLHQGKGLFLKLASMTYALAAEMGYEFVVGIANANSTPGFVRKLTFQLVTPMNAMVGIGRLPVSRPHSVGAISYEPLWDATSLRWRTSNPEASYSWVARGRSGKYIVAPTGRKWLDALLWRGELVDPSILGLPKRGRTPRLCVWLGLDPGLPKWFPWYLPIPQAVRPSPLNLIFRDLTGKGRVLRRGDIRFDALDFDAY